MTEFSDWLEQKEARRARKRARKEGIREYTQVKRKKITKRRKAGFSEETRTEAHRRAGGHCENPLCRRKLPGLGGEHHCLPRSQYHKADRNGLWNCAAICSNCHERITSPKTDSDKRLRRYFERLAVARRDLVGSIYYQELDLLTKQLIDGSLDLNKSKF